jgi:16S rRNA (guanine1207-N2)-methyltransferase
MTEHYSTPKPKSEERFGEYTYDTGSGVVSITTVSGVFGKGGIDRGSQVLIEYADLSGVRSVLDLGCGTGIVGIALSKRCDITVTFADVNERAVRIAERNARTNGVSGFFIVSDGFEHIDAAFDAIMLNPPQSAGKDVCERLISEAFEHLLDGGRLFVVARHKKGGRSLSEYMESVFGSLSVLARKSGYRVYMGERR